MSLLAEVRAAITGQGLLAPGQGVLVALSGGPDSVVLAHCLQRLGHPVVAAHFDHGLRASSADEARQVAAWCASWDLPFVGGVAPGPLPSMEAARDARYWFLAEAARDAGLTAVATGHHRDDQAETVLFRLARGAGPDGLAGMAACRPLGPGVQLIRPFLGTPRVSIAAALAAWALPSLDDPTNRDPARARSRVRASALPALAEVHPEAGAHLATLAGLAGDERAHAARETERLARFLARPDGDGRIEVNRLAFNLLPLVPRRRLVRAWAVALGIRPPDAATVVRILEAASAGTGVSVRGGWGVQAFGAHLVFERGELPIAGPVQWLGTQPTTPYGWDVVATAPTGAPHGPCHITLPPNPNLLWRAGHPGRDRFWAPGHQREGTLAHALSRFGVPAAHRQRMLVLADDQVVWWLVGCSPSARLLAGDPSPDGVEMQATARFRV